MPNPVDRFWCKVAQGEVDKCWSWLGAAGRYGKFYAEGQGWEAHRFSYAHSIGPIPEGLTIDHLCRNTLCVNPSHLEAVTMRENILRGDGMSAIHARKTHCINGHPLSGENLYLRPKGGRDCRICKAQAFAKWKERHV